MQLTLDQALQRGIEAYKAGKVQDADGYYTAILKANPKHPDANHNMGVLAVSVGKIDEALPFLKTAVEAKPNKAQYWLIYIDTLIRLDRIDDARAVCEQAKSYVEKGNEFAEIEKNLSATQNIKRRSQKTFIPQEKIEQIINRNSKLIQEGFTMDEKKDEKTTDPLLEEKKDNLTRKIKTEKFSSEITTAVKRNASKVCSKKFLYNRLPILTWLFGYNLEMLLCDTIAGVTTALTVIPLAVTARVAVLSFTVILLKPNVLGFEARVHVPVVVVNEEGVVGMLLRNSARKLMPMTAPIAHHAIADHKRRCSRSNGPRGRSDDHGMLGLNDTVVGNFNPVGAVWI